MNKMIVVVFDDEKTAFRGLSALGSLHKEGALTLYSTAVIAKDPNGKPVVKQAADKGPTGTVIGLATGGLLGLLAGPIGLAVGASVGGLTGVLVDLDKTGVDIGFVLDVSEALSPGKVAVLAEVDEMWMAPLDTRMGDLGGLIFRRLRSEVIDDQLAREAEALEQELQELQAELAEANEETKAAISKQMDDARKKLEAINTTAKDKLKKTVDEGEAKLSALQAQIANASDRQKAKMEKRRAELEAEYRARVKKLEQAATLTKEALAV